ncbi:MAG: glucosaminidase domain-containing protein [Candidatus Levybacteria bacterium]|nr:glucosaminidase domain-containing protein [Candidatus Levybacteria bacterium]
MNKTLITYALIALAVMTITPQAKASHKVSASSAALIQTPGITNVDNRAQILRDYLIKKNSPLADSAETFIKEADKNDLDWRLVVSISGLESGFGKHIPVNSYNGWGWGIYGDNSLGFASWDEAISTISEGLRTKYMDKWGLSDIYSIGRTYASSPTWAQRVTFFMNDLEKFQSSWSDSTLSISI